jgi:hypothetical protein
MEAIQVESGVALPAVRVVYRYPYGQMKVGDSFTVPRSARAKVLNANFRASKRFGMTFTSKADGDLVRVWRLT